MTQTDLISALVAAIIVFITLWIGQKLLSVLLSYFKFINEKLVEKGYREFLEMLSNRENLMILFLEKISRSVSILALWALGLLLLFSPSLSKVSFEFKYFCVTTMSFSMFLLAVTALSKPINFCYAIRNPEKYRVRVKRKLGRLPDEII